MLPQYAYHQPGINETEDDPEKNKRSDINSGECSLADLCQTFAIFRHGSGSARVSRVGDCVSQSRTFLDHYVEIHLAVRGKFSSARRADSPSRTGVACATPEQKAKTTV